MASNLLFFSILFPAITPNPTAANRRTTLQVPAITLNRRCLCLYTELVSGSLASSELQARLELNPSTIIGMSILPRDSPAFSASPPIDCQLKLNKPNPSNTKRTSVLTIIHAQDPALLVGTTTLLSSAL